MAMGKRKHLERQADLWVPTAALPDGGGHVFYTQLDALLVTNGFDKRVEHLCRRYYKGPQGQPSIAPGTYFRALLVGYFEGLDSERGIAWRLADSLSLRRFLGYGLEKHTPDHSTISRTRRLFALSTHQAVFRWVLERVKAEGLLRTKTIGIDATTLEANAAMRSIVRRDTGESYRAYLKTLARNAGIDEPTPAQLQRFDRRRKKKGSNKDWESPVDPDARITRMKDGRTHLAHKAEHAVDLDTGALLALTLQPADRGDTSSVGETMAAATENAAAVDVGPIEEGVLDRGYHSGRVLTAFSESGTRGYIAEPERKRRRWQGRGKQEEQRQLYANRRRLRGARNRRLQAKRAELNERCHAHLYETGGMRRVHLRGRENIQKRLLIHGAAYNLGLVMRARLGVGTPRGMKTRKKTGAEPVELLSRLRGALHGVLERMYRCFEAWSQISAPDFHIGAAA
jgi:transposase